MTCYRTFCGIVLALLVAILACGLAACGDDDSGAGDGDADGDSDTDSGTDTGECVAPYEWGSGLEQYQTVGNWAFSGYVDSDGDGVVEQEAVDFDMDYIYCSGRQSVVLAVTDTS